MNKNISKLLEKYDIETSAGCVEPRYDDKSVAKANWNHIPQKVYDRLEKAGYSCEWEDEWIECDHCYKSFRTSPNSWGWEMFGHIFDGYALCGNCIEWDEFLESMENNPKLAVTCSLFYKFENEITSRYTLVKDEFEAGFHPHQTDNPAKILENLLKDTPKAKFIFVIDGQGQFDITFSVYKKIEG